MLRADPEIPLTEPIIIPVAFVNGAAVSAENNIVMITGWTCFGQQHSDCCERRICARIAMTVETARAIHRELARWLLYGH